MLVPTKPVWQSKTVLLNVIGIAILLLSSADVLAVLPPEAVKYEAATLAVLNILNRFLTTVPVSLTGGDKPDA